MNPHLDLLQLWQFVVADANIEAILSGIQTRNAYRDPIYVRAIGNNDLSFMDQRRRPNGITEKPATAVRATDKRIEEFAQAKRDLLAEIRGEGRICGDVDFQPNRAVDGRKYVYLRAD